DAPERVHETFDALEVDDHRVIDANVEVGFQVTFDLFDARRAAAAGADAHAVRRVDATFGHGTVFGVDVHPHVAREAEEGRLLRQRVDGDDHEHVGVEDAVGVV